MANDLVLSERDHYLSVATAKNYLDVIQHIYETEMICLTNKGYSEQTIYKLYDEYIEMYDMIPELVDICDEITFFNGDVLNKIAQIMQKYDPTAITMYQRNMAEFVDGHFVHDEEEVITELMEQIAGDLTTEMHRNQDSYSREEIAEVLTKRDLPFILDYDDDIYTALRYLQDSGHVILVNDCQQSFLQEIYNQKYDEIYNQPGFYDKRVGRYSIIKVADRQHSGAKELTFQKGW